MSQIGEVFGCPRWAFGVSQVCVWGQFGVSWAAGKCVTDEASQDVPSGVLGSPLWGLSGCPKWGVSRHPAQGALGVPELRGTLGCYSRGTHPGDLLAGRGCGAEPEAERGGTRNPPPLQLTAISGHKGAADSGGGSAHSSGGAPWLWGTCMCR